MKKSEKTNENGNVVFTGMSPLGYTVTLVKDDWEHIKNSHQIMSNNLSAIEETVSFPAVIYQCNGFANRQAYFAYPETTYNNDLVTKVIVEVDDVNNTGEVVTAFPQKGIKGGIDGNKLLYIKSRL